MTSGLWQIARTFSLFRLIDSQSGLSLEKKLDPQKPVASQKKKLLEVFDAALTRAELMAA